MASGLSTRLKLPLPSYTDSADVADIDTAFVLIDTYAPNTTCARLSRPANPFAGQKIYETDTGYERIWNGLTLSWESVNAIRVLSTDTRPVGPFIGDRLVETNTGIMRQWNGTRWKCLGQGSLLYTELTQFTTAIGAAQIDVVDVSANAVNLGAAFNGDGVTPYMLELVVPSIVPSGTVVDTDQLSLSIMESIDGGAYASIHDLVLIAGHSTNTQFSDGGMVRRKITPTSAHTHAYKLMGQRTSGTTTFVVRASATKPLILSLTEL